MYNPSATITVSSTKRFFFLSAAAEVLIQWGLQSRQEKLRDDAKKKISLPTPGQIQQCKWNSHVK